MAADFAESRQHDRFRFFTQAHRDERFGDARITRVASAVQSHRHGGSGQVALLLSCEAIIGYFDYRIDAEQSLDVVAAAWHCGDAGPRLRKIHFAGSLGWRLEELSKHRPLVPRQSQA